jgi:hypothetical protein
MASLSSPQLAVIGSPGPPSRDHRSTEQIWVFDDFAGWSGGDVERAVPLAFANYNVTPFAKLKVLAHFA